MEDNQFRYPIFVKEFGSNLFTVIVDKEDLNTIEEIDILDEEYTGWDIDGKLIKLDLIEGKNTVIVTSHEIHED